MPPKAFVIGTGYAVWLDLDCDFSFCTGAKTLGLRLESLGASVLATLLGAQTFVPGSSTISVYFQGDGLNPQGFLLGSHPSSATAAQC